MKRTADEAALSMVPQRFRVNVFVPPEPLTNNQEMHFQLHCDSTSTVDSVKRTLVHQMYTTLGQCPRISSFQLQQGGRQMAFTQSITTLSTLLPLQFVRTAPDQ